MDRRRCVRLAWLPVVIGLLTPGAAAATSGPGLTVRTKGVHRYGGGFVVLSKERVRVRATAVRAVAGTILTVRISQRGHDLLMARHTVGRRRSFVHSVVPAGRGVVTIRVRLAAGTGQVLARRRALHAGVIQPTASLGDSGARVRFLQRRLAGLRYAVPVHGRYDDATARAVIAFRKVNRMERVGNASRTVFKLAARGRGAFRPKHGGAAHVEGDLTRQVLALVNRGGRVFKVYMTSSGRPSLRTPAGVHRFWRKDRGWNSEGMLDSAYFVHAGGGHTDCAIHGYFVVPTWNASHCCFRVPIPDARKIFNWVRIGERIYVYY